MVANFGVGSGPRIITHSKARLGVQICYDSLFDSFSTELQKQKAQILVNLTNDSWFGYPFEPYQHMYFAMGRAIENRIPLIRLTNTGITSVVNARGRVLIESTHGKPWGQIVKVPFSSHPTSTFYPKIAEHWTFCLILALLAVLIGNRALGD